MTIFVAGLQPAEVLLLHAIRGWITARATGARPRVVSAALAARSTPEAGARFAAWMQAIEAALRHPVQLPCESHLCCGGVSADEARLIIACGLAGADFQAGKAVLQPILSEPDIVAKLGCDLASALSAGGWPLPVRRPTVAPPGRQVSPTFH